MSVKPEQRIKVDKPVVEVSPPFLSLRPPASSPPARAVPPRLLRFPRCMKLTRLGNTRRWTATR